MENEPIFYRGGKDEEVRLDPATLNLDELPLMLAMAGWMVLISYEEDEQISLTLRNMGGAGGRSSDVVAYELGIVDNESGEILEGFSVEGEGEGLTVNYHGVANTRFASFTKTLHGLSPF